MQNSSDQALVWEDVRYFLALIRQGSLSAAARKLEVEHSTVARRVDALERALGLRLFDRLPRGWRLTPEGEQLVEQAVRMEDEALAFARAAAGASPLGGTVRISVPPSLGTVFLMPQLAARHDIWRGIELEVMGETREANLSRREADIALRLGQPGDLSLAVRPLGEVGYGLYGHPDFARLPHEQWRYIGLDDSLSQTPQYQWMERFAGGAAFSLRSNDVTAMIRAAGHGLGVTTLPHYCVDEVADLIELPVEGEPVPGRSLWLVVHPDVRRSPRVRLVADMLIAICEENRGLLEHSRRLAGD